LESTDIAEEAPETSPPEDAASSPSDVPADAVARAPDTESPASVRKTFVALTFAGAVLLLPPRQWISSMMLAGVFLVLAYRWRKDVDTSFVTTLAAVYFTLFGAGFAADRVAAHYHWVIPY